jgi:hypothetical protein
MRKLGIFFLNGQSVREYSTEVKRIMGMCTILRAEHMLSSNKIEYVAICDKFRSIHDGEMMPRYQIIIDDGHPIFTEIQP